MGKPVMEILEQIGALLEIKGETPFKSKAYYRAAKTLSGIENIDEIIKNGQLKEIKGIGEALSGRIEEYAATGKMRYFEDLKKEIPESLLTLTDVPNLGPKKIRILFDDLGITNIGELEYACRENRLVNLKGFGLKTQEKILKGIEFIKRHAGEFLLGDVYPPSMGIRERLTGVADSGLVEICGGIRRRKEVVRGIGVLIAGDDRDSLTAAFVAMPEVDEVLLMDETKTSCRLKSGIGADLRVVSRAAFPYALMHFTGSRGHNVKLGELSKTKGWKLGEYGFFEEGRPMLLGDEEEIYGALGLAFIPPELREDTGEIEAAREGRLPELVSLDDIKGLFHIHSDFSDGVDSIERLAFAAREMGFYYAGISDHSKSAYYAGGLKVDDVYRQWDIIDGLNENDRGFHIFKGIESDIRPDGSLDYDEDVLKGFDFIIASVHSNFNLKRDEQERRIINAMKNPYTTILGHPTGRLLLSRDGYDVDMKTIIDAAAEYGVVIELNASPYRLDIDWRYLKYAKKKGVMVSINPDAHSVAGLSEIFYGVGIARKGWQEAKDILNTQIVSDIRDTFKKIRDGKRYTIDC